MGAESEALFIPRGDAFLPTEYSRGPWDRHALHGGSVAALIAHAVDAHEPEPPMAIARLTVELIRPVPTRELRVAVRTVRPGRRVQLLEVSLMADTTEVVRASVVRLRRLAPDGLAVHGVAPPAIPRVAPEDCAIPDWRNDDGNGWTGLWHMMDARMASGVMGEPGPAACWFRLECAVVADEAVLPIERVVAAADFGSGVGSPVSFDTWLYINPEITIHLLRDPVDEWVLVDSGGYADGDGIGLAETRLEDRDGVIGRAAQSVLVDVLPEGASGQTA